MAKTSSDAESTSFVLLLRTCAKKKDLFRGFVVHVDILKRGLLEKRGSVANSLVSMYAKCGALPKARQVLEELHVRDVVSWSALIAGYAQLGHGKEALNCFELMQHEGIFPDAVTFICILKACGSMGALDKGELIHNEIDRCGLLGKDVALGNALIDMYANCGALLRAHRVLEQLPFRDVVSWSTLISGYAQRGQGYNALSCFEQMRQRDHLAPNVVTFLCVLKACGSLGATDKGEQIQNEIVRQGLLKDNMVLGTALVDMYAKCGALTKAKQVLYELPLRDVVTWSALIAGYAEQGQGEDALNCFECMRHEGFLPNAITFISVLKACGSVGSTDKGEQIHDEIVRHGLLGKDIVLSNALVDMYAKCGALVKAQQVLEELPVRNVVSWNSLIAGYAQKGQGQDALDCFERMQGEGLSPDEVTYVCLLNACGSLGALEKGKQIRNKIIKQGLLKTNVDVGIALVNMYSKCGALANAEGMLDEFHVPHAAPWSALIARYAEQGQGEAALKCFGLMQHKGLSPDEITYAYILKACSSVRAFDKGKELHDEIVEKGLLKNNVVLGTALVDMYAKCGELPKAQEVLDELQVRNATAWSALISGYAQQGRCKDALNCFEQMQHKGFSPDSVTFSCVLNACSHSGFLEEGQMYFAQMSSKYGITPSIEHYTCMVDLYGRAGHFEKAIAVIQRMPSADHLVVWSALLGACQKWRDVSVGRWAFEHAVQVDKSDAAPYVCMANIYAVAGMQKDAACIEALRKKNEAIKN